MNTLLAKEYQYLLESSDEERMAFIFQYRWINYPRAKLMLDKLEELFKYGKNFPRITSLLIVGEGNNGKSSIISRFAELHPPYDYNIERPA
ncbi:TniB family NTP-binding protein, partial [Sulfuricurvum sp.]|uniref:TniB family NTP-binding protein n=1 Tax=Sulfuricurvum sp. TaxID=2025608 RepID=UPI00262C0E88